MTRPARTTRVYRVTLRTPDGGTRDVDIEASTMVRARERAEKAWPGYRIVAVGRAPREEAS